MTAARARFAPRAVDIDRHAMAEPPSMAAGELTDKGYINQRAYLENHASEVAALYAGGADVLTFASNQDLRPAGQSGRV